MGRQYSFSAKSAEISMIIVIVVPLHPLGGPFYLVQKSKFFGACGGPFYLVQKSKIFGACGGPFYLVQKSKIFGACGGPFYLVQKSKFFAAKAIETL